MTAAEVDASTKASLRTIGLEAGLDAVGFTDAAPFDDTREILEERRDAGLHGGMQFTYRNPARSTEPGRILDGAATLVVAARAYPADRPLELSTDVPKGEIAAYAWRDHYTDLKSGLSAMADALIADGHQARVVADDNALVDRAAAVRAGIGWFGKNSNVLLPRRGSWFVLGAVVTTAVFEPDTPVEPRCGTCTRCIDGCPTDAIVGDGVIDARRCLAWLLQLGGMFPVQYREALGARVYGCDDCQVVCPPNRESPVPLLGDEVMSTDLMWMLEAPDDEILEQHGRWYIPNREVRYLRRNALIAFANGGGGQADRAASLIARYLADDDPMLRAHAVWAAKRLGFDDLYAEVAGDDDGLVAAELARQVTPVGTGERQP